MKAKIVITGGSGFLAQSLAQHFAGQNYEVVLLTRQNKESSGPIRYVPWDGKTLSGWEKELEHAHLVVNLAGKSVNCRYTPEARKEILDSRILATQAIGKAIQSCIHTPALWINASSATIYRHAEDRAMDEWQGEIGEGFSVDVCRQWEQSFFEAPTPVGLRKVALRIAIVLSTEEGAFPRIKKLVRLGMGGRQGKGTQMVSWVHIEDVLGAIDFIINHPELQGVYNVAAPMPVSNRYLMSSLSETMKRPIQLPTPRWLLQLGAAFIGTETELILKSRWVIPRKLLDAGYRFSVPTIDECWKKLLLK